MKNQSIIAKFAAVMAVFTYFSLGADAAERVRIARVDLGGQPIKAVTGSDGSIHLLLQGKAGPRYAKSSDDGQTFSKPLEILDPARPVKSGLEFAGEDMAVGKDGKIFVAMSNNAWKLKLPESEWGLYLATLESGASQFTRAENLNQKPSEGFSLAADSRGFVTAAFLSGKLYTKNSRNNGLTFSKNAEPDSSWNPCDCCTTSAAYGPDGKLALLYREETNNDRDMFVVLIGEQESGKPVRRRVSNTSWKLPACPMTYFSINSSPDGYVAAWPTKGEIYFARLDKEGALLPPGEIKTPGRNGMRTGVLALQAKDGVSLIGWKNGETLGWQLYGPDGKTMGETGAEPSSGHGAAGVILRNGDFMMFP